MEIRPYGPSDARIMLVQENPGYDELKASEPFQGHAGKELNRMLQESGISRSTCFATSVVRRQIPFNDITRVVSQRKADITPLHRPLHDRYVLEPFLVGLHQLEKEIDLVRPRVILAFGNGALFALTGKWGVKSWRGSELQYVSPGGHHCVVIPVYTPNYILQVWKDRQITITDFRRARRVVERPADYIAPEYNFIVRPSFSTVGNLLSGLLRRLDAGETLKLSVDIETRGGHIACTGIAWSKTDAICIPHLVSGNNNYWLEEEESFLVHLLYRVLTHEKVEVVGQNFLYDAQYFWRHFHFIPRLVRDTMISQHSMFSNIPKGLDYLSAMYCEHHLYWKGESKDWDPKLGEDQLWIYNCLAGDTSVLMADCTWKRLENITEGEFVMAFDEEPTGESYARRLRPAEVTKKASAWKKLYKVNLSNGSSIKATADHKFLVSGKRADTKATHSWKELRNISVGDTLRFLSKPWHCDYSYEAGWMAGVLDGEGTLGVSKAGGGHFPRFAIAQKRGLVWDKILRILTNYGFSFGTSDKHGVGYVDIRGGLSENLRLMGLFPNERLLFNLVKGGIDHGWSGFSQIDRPTVVSIEEMEDDLVYDISTTQSTFIANGIVVHNCKDCVITYEVDEAEQASIQSLESGGWSKIREVHNFQQSLFYPVLETMNTGIRVDNDSKGRLSTELSEAISARETWLESTVGHPLNIKSPKQMLDFFYRELAQKPVISRKTGNPTCDDSALEKIGQREPLLLPVLEKIADLRSLGVFRSTFLEAPVDADQRMRCSFNIAGTETYRFSSSQNAFGSGMNLQNVPVGDEGSGLPNIRSLFLPDDEMTFFDIDLDSADLRIVVWESDCIEMKQMFAEGLKPYVEVAKEYYRDPTITKSHPSYKLFKALCHGTNYLGTASGLSGRIGLLANEVERIQKWYYGKFPEIRKWQDGIISAVDSKRWIENVFGYREYFFDRIEGTIYNQAVAWIPQSTVACLINRGYKNIYEKDRDIQVLLQVHDSLAGQYPTCLGDAATQRITDLCSVPLPYAEPLIIPVGINTSETSWGGCK